MASGGNLGDTENSAIRVEPLPRSKSAKHRSLTQPPCGRQCAKRQQLAQNNAPVTYHDAQWRQKILIWSKRWIDSAYAQSESVATDNALDDKHAYTMGHLSCR